MIGGKTLEMQVNTLAVRRLPGHTAITDALAQICVSPEIKQPAAVEAKLFSVDGDPQIQPIGQIDQLGKCQWHVVPHAMDKGEGRLTGIPFFKGSTGGHVAVAQRIDRLHVVLRRGVESILDDVPARARRDGGDEFRYGHVLQIVSSDKVPVAGGNHVETVGGPESQDGHSGRQRALDACLGILDDQRTGGRHAKLRGGKTEQERKRLLLLDAVPVGDQAQAAGDAEALADDARVLAGRGDGIWDLGLVEPVKQVGYAGKQVGWTNVVQ